MEYSEKHTAFNRQRRFLMAISIVMIFITSADIKLKTIDIFGTTFDVLNPDVVTLTLWIAFGYWFGRYLQFLTYLQDRHIYGTFRDRIFKYTYKYAEEEFKKQILAEYKQKNYEVRRIEVSSKGWDKRPSMKNPFSRRSISIIGNVGCMVGVVSKVEGENRVIDIKQSKQQYISTWVRALSYTYFVTPLFTEYVLPPLLAAIAIVVGVVHLFIN
ncbi:MAG: hypothetical protein ACRESU_00865 [Gammaproteobacteria bacterium]